jgi:hypothetical protein
MPTYKRVKGDPATATRAEPDPYLEASKRWKRVDEAKAAKADDKPKSSPATAGESKE